MAVAGYDDVNEQERKLVMNNDGYLYHYTNIEALALILKNRTIRFNSLNKMDDLQEERTADIKNIGQFCYISSWTDEPTESIPMWKMYASLNVGARIKIRKNPFMVYKNTAESLSHVTNLPVKDESNGEELRSLILIAEMIQKGFVSAQALNRNILYKVEYTDDEEKLYPHLVSEKDDGYSIAMGKLGKYKNLHWSFQNEWRYILSIIPFNMGSSSENLVAEFQATANKMRMGTAQQPFPYYDMHLTDDAFSDMEITLSPRISAGSKVIIDSLVEKYNPSARVRESSLTGLI